ncbi:MAG: hypothetical protein U0694_14875 [Anaerolineae bacterium]
MRHHRADRPQHVRQRRYEHALGGDISGEIAILLASLCFGIGTNFSRKMLKDQGIETIVVATVSMDSAAIITFILMFALPLVGDRAPVSYASVTGDAILWSAVGFRQHLYRLPDVL